MICLFKLTAFATNAATTTADNTTEIIIFLPLMGAPLSPRLYICYPLLQVQS